MIRPRAPPSLSPLVFCALVLGQVGVPGGGGAYRRAAVSIGFVGWREYQVSSSRTISATFRRGAESNELAG